MFSKKFKGLFAEYYSLFFLFLSGYAIVEHRFKTKYGETDLIVKKGNVLIFVEVKYVRNNKYLYKAIYSSDLRRLVNNAKIYKKKYYKNNIRIRFDIIFVYDKMKIRHLQNVYL